MTSCCCVEKLAHHVAAQMTGRTRAEVTVACDQHFDRNSTEEDLALVGSSPR